MESLKRVCFAALVIPAPPDVECHITIGVAKDVTEPETRIMQQELERKIRPHLPIQVEICNYRLRGNDNTIPTYDVSFPDPAVDHMLKSYYRTYYKGDPAKRQYPHLEPHVTVDTPSKLAWIEEIIRGNQKGCVQVTDTTFQVRNEGGEAVFNNETWRCNSCARLNPIVQKECSTPGCSQWRPQQAMPRREGDWECCGSIVFGSKPSCFKCGRPNPSMKSVHTPIWNGSPMTSNQRIEAPSAPFAPSEVSVYEAPPSAPQPSGGSFPRVYRSDWLCCGDMVFGSKLNCRKCGRKRPN